MYSELVGISLDGKLYQWKWSSEQSFSVSINLNSLSFNDTQMLSNNQVVINHPKTVFLQLINEKICGISTSPMRASCWTESGKVIIFKRNFGHFDKKNFFFSRLLPGLMSQ